ncbi:MAG: hypothetical protein LBB76_08740, partial [Azoarcus sp.]|nr:hypothetical protein [Azoarcus sp.]
MSQRSLGIILCLLLLLNLLVMLPKWLGSTNGRTPKEWTQQRDWDKPTDPRELEAYNFAHSLELPLGRGLPDPERFRFEDYRQMP